jgi:hypothetical protein
MLRKSDADTQQKILSAQRMPAVLSILKSGSLLDPHNRLVRAASLKVYHPGYPQATENRHGFRTVFRHGKQSALIQTRRHIGLTNCP